MSGAKYESYLPVGVVVAGPEATGGTPGEDAPPGGAAPFGGVAAGFGWFESNFTRSNVIVILRSFSSSTICGPV